MTRKLASAPSMLSIGELAFKAQCEVQTIRYYEQIGVLPKPARSEGGHRFYTDAQVQRLLFIRRARDLGFPLDQVKELLRLADNKEGECSAVDKIASQRLADVRQKITQLTALEQELKRMVRGCRRGAISECRIVQALSN